MKVLGLLVTLGAVCWFLYGWFIQYNQTLEQEIETPEGFEGGITAPIDAAEEARKALEGRYQ